MTAMKNTFLFCLILFTFNNGFTQSVTFDQVIINGRVIDPETGLDDIRNIGINGNQIVALTTQDIKGTKVLDAKGKVVCPGFIDLHVHGMTNAEHVYQLHDGVTTALELEGGVGYIDRWIAEKEGNSLVNFGASVPHGTIRAQAMDAYQGFFKEIEKKIDENGFSDPSLSKLWINLARSSHASLSNIELENVGDLIDHELESGALGIGVPVGYYPGSTGNEIFQVYKHAAKRNMPIFSHTRGFKLPGIHEAIANALITGAPLHICHLNSLSLSEIDHTLQMVQEAQDNGLDITAEVYPYTAGSTYIESAVFDEGWQESLGISYGDIQWEATGERLTEETFKKYRAEGGLAIIHMMKEDWIVKGLQHPVTMIASDGVLDAPGAHPRTAGTYSRILGKYVREDKIMDLPLAIYKMTLMPAQRLEKISPMMTRKGRIQVGTDADIVIFDPESVIDKATFKRLVKSEGITDVFVNGVHILKNSKIQEGLYPGRAIVSRFKN